MNVQWQEHSIRRFYIGRFSSPSIHRRRGINVLVLRVVIYAQGISKNFVGFVADRLFNR